MNLEKKDFEFLQPMIYKSIETYFKNKENADFEKQIFNKTQTAEKLGRSYGFITNLINAGYLKTTADGKHITGLEINNYLGITDNKKTVSNGNIETA